MIFKRCSPVIIILSFTTKSSIDFHINSTAQKIQYKKYTIFRTVSATFNIFSKFRDEILRDNFSLCMKCFIHEFFIQSIVAL